MEEGEVGSSGERSELGGRCGRVDMGEKWLRGACVK